METYRVYWMPDLSLTDPNYNLAVYDYIRTATVPPDAEDLYGTIDSREAAVDLLGKLQKANPDAVYFIIQEKTAIAWVTISEPVDDGVIDGAI